MGLSSIHRDIFKPVFKNAVTPAVITPEQDWYIREILDTCCSDSRFAQKAYDALKYVLTQAIPPNPVLSSLNPATAVIGDPIFDLHVIGTGFTDKSIITFNGLDEPTVFVSPTELTTGINMPLWTAPAVVPVMVRNENGIMTSPMNFEFTAPV